MATRSEMRTNILNQLGEDGTGFITTAEVNTWIEKAHQEAAEMALCIETESLSMTVANADTYALPIDLLSLIRVFVGGRELQEISIGEYRGLKEDDRNLKSGVQCYAEWNGAIYLFPAPDMDGETIRLYYFRRGNALDEDGEVPDFAPTFHKIIEDYALWRAYLKYRDVTMAREHQAAWLDGLRRLRVRYGPDFHKMHGTRIKVVR